MNKKWPSHFAYHGHPVPGMIWAHHHLSLKSMILIWKAESRSAHWPMLPRMLSCIGPVHGPIPAPPRRPSGNLRTKFHQIVASWLSFDSSLSIMKSRSSDINGFKPHRPPALQRSSSSRMPWNRTASTRFSKLCRWRAQKYVICDIALCPWLASGSKGTTFPSLVARLSVLDHPVGKFDVVRS